MRAAKYLSLYPDQHAPQISQMPLVLPMAMKSSALLPKMDLESPRHAYHETIHATDAHHEAISSAKQPRPERQTPSVEPATIPIAIPDEVPHAIPRSRYDRMVQTTAHHAAYAPNERPGVERSVTFQTHNPSDYASTTHPVSMQESV
jgi:hypothetical protein